MTVVSLTSAAAIEAVLRGRAARNRSESDEFIVFYRSPNGRQFCILFDTDGFYLGECIPVGLRRVLKDGKIDFIADTALTQLMQEDDPNAFAWRCRELGYEENEVVRRYEPPMDVDLARRYFDKCKGLDEVAEKISNALSMNKWFRSEPKVGRLPPRRDMPPARNQTADQREFLEKYENHSRETERGLFCGLFNMSGNLSRVQKNAILSYLEAPSREKWKTICNMQIKGGLVLWDAIRRVDRDAPIMMGTSGRPFPSAAKLKRYLKQIGQTSAVALHSVFNEQPSQKAESPLDANEGPGPSVDPLP